jgi:ribosomal protein S27AE
MSDSMATDQEYIKLGHQFLDAYYSMRRSIDRLVDIIEKDPRCAKCAASVLLYAHNKNGPIYDLHLLPKEDFDAAIFVIDASRDVQPGLYGRLAYGINAAEALEKLEDIISKW